MTTSEKKTQDSEVEQAMEELLHNSDDDAQPTLHQPEYVEPMDVEETGDVAMDMEETPDATVVRETPVDDTTTTTSSTPVDDVSTEEQVTPDSSQVATDKSPEGSDTERSTITPDPEIYPGLVDDNIPQAEEVGGDPNLQEHTTFTENHIRGAEVHFALRRSKPLLYRHRATCRSHVRFFDGIDDGVYLAKSGVVWSIPIRGREELLEVIAVACLGYREDDAKKKNNLYKSKSAKVQDTRATMILVRPYNLIGTDLRLQDMRVLTACELFRKGKPYPTVDIRQQIATQSKTEELIEELEGDGGQRPCKGHLWLKIKPLFDVQPMPPALPPVTAVEADSKADGRRRTSKRRDRMREVAARLRADEKMQEKQLAAAAAAEKKKVEQEKAKRRRYVNKVVDRKLAKVHTHTHTQL